jgi:cytochrome c-type protein NapB
MKTGIILAGVVLSVAGTGAATAGGAIDELNMGLSKTSVFDTPTPEPFEYSQTKPKKSDRLPRAYTDIPPQIPHRVDEYLPITAADNQCLDCHEQPDLIGKKKEGKSPMPRDHYVDLRSSSDKMSDGVVGARFNCTQCHVPQSGAPPLVENTFKGSK